jgi:hypothetical protein
MVQNMDGLSGLNQIRSVVKIFSPKILSHHYSLLLKLTVFILENLRRMSFHISLLASFAICILPVEGYRLIAESL